jgi:hypothetical protein
MGHFRKIHLVHLRLHHQNKNEHFLSLYAKIREPMNYFVWLIAIKTINQLKDKNVTFSLLG